MKDDILKGIVEKIKSEKIQPEPKWRLRFKSYFFWFLLIGTVFFGALFFSLIIFNILDLNLGLIYHLKFQRSMRLLLNVIPYLWIWFLFIFLFLSFLIFRKTRKGYRYKSIFVVSLIIAGIFFLGTIVHLSSMDEMMDETFFKKTPPTFRAHMPFRENRLKNPEEGFLGGEIINFDGKIIAIRTLQEENWRVEISPQTQVKRRVRLEVREKIFVVGEKIGENLFEAFFIGPLEPPHFFGRKR